MLKRVWSIVVAVALLFTMACFAFADGATALEVTVDGSKDLRPGDKVTATVQLNNYADNWSAMSIDVTYDNALFDLDGSLEEAVRFEGFVEGIDGAIHEVYEVSPGLLRFVWMAMENIAYDGSTLVEIDLVAKAKANGASAISAVFVKDGQLTTNAEGTPAQVPADGDAFSTEPATEELTVRGVDRDEQPTIRLDLNGHTRMQVKKSYDVFIYIDKYIPWSQLSVDLNLSEAAFADHLVISGVEPLGYTGTPVISGNNITVTNAANVDAAGSEYLADGSLKALKVTLTPTKDLNPATLVASFAEGKQSEAAEGTLEGGVHYSAVASAQSLILVPDKTGLSVTIEEPEDGQWNSGDEFDVFVSLKDHANAWTAFTLVGTYDPEKFQVIDIDTESYSGALGTDSNGIPYTAVEPEKLTDNLEIVWISTGNIAADPQNPNPTVMRIRFKALAASDGSSISFAFKSDGVIAEDENGVLQNQTSGTNFTEESIGESVTVAPKPMKLTYEIEGGVESIKAGKPFSVTVSVNDCYEKLSALSIKGSYETSQFELVGVEPLLKNFGEYGTVISPDSAEALAECNADGEAEIVWISPENVALASSFEAVKLTFVAKEQADAATIEFGFIEGGILASDSSGGLAPLDKGTYYEETPVEATIKIDPSKVMLEVRTDAENIMAGDEFTVEVYVVDYYSPLAAISIEGVLPEGNYALISATAETIGGVEAIQDEDGQLQFVWYSAENIVTGAQEFKALTLKLKALHSTDDTTDDIKFTFIPGGMVRVDADGMVNGLDAGVHYAHPVTEPAIAEVPVAQKPVTLAAESKVSTVAAGETFDVTVSLSEFYEGDWSSLGIWADFDAADFKVVNATTDANFDGVFSWTDENEGKPFVAGWVAIDNVEKFPAMTVTIEALKDATIDDALEQIDFYFASNATYTCVDADTLNYQLVASDGSAYALEAEAFTINIIAADTTVAVNIRWGSMEFTYNYGKWNVETHTWDNAGWTCAEEENAIAVENVGEVGVTAGYGFEAGEEMTGITGEFDQNDVSLDPVGGEVSNVTVYFILKGKTEDEWEGQETVGSITVTVTANGLEEVPNE